MVLLRAISTEEAEELAIEWGYRRLVDTDATLTADRELNPIMAPKTLDALAQEGKCKVLLRSMMKASPGKKLRTKEQVWPEMKKAFPLVQKRTFMVEIWPHVSEDFPAWRKRGRL